MLVAAPGDVSGRRLFADAALVALAANLGNLLDRAPGRAIKVSLLCLRALAAPRRRRRSACRLAPVLGAALGLLWADMRERLMLGDTGANLLGGGAGPGRGAGDVPPGADRGPGRAWCCSTWRPSGCRSRRSSTPPPGLRHLDLPRPTNPDQPAAVVCVGSRQRSAARTVGWGPGDSWGLR